eukprot:m.65705 g.65705  ORF g.65705 m.65705 type:complete len:107 (+) comp15928_c0_seq2:1772-2092(+)
MGPVPRCCMLTSPMAPPSKTMTALVDTYLVKTNIQEPRPPTLEADVTWITFGSAHTCRCHCILFTVNNIHNDNVCAMSAREPHRGIHGGQCGGLETLAQKVWTELR